MDWPPTSMMSAPAAASALACATAAPRLACRPPSLKLSGVTLRMPMTCSQRERVCVCVCVCWEEGERDGEVEVEGKPSGRPQRTVRQPGDGWQSPPLPATQRREQTALPAHLRASLPGPEPQAAHGQHTLQVGCAQLPLAARSLPQAGGQPQLALEAALAAASAPLCPLAALAARRRTACLPRRCCRQGSAPRTTAAGAAQVCQRCFHKVPFLPSRVGHHQRLPLCHRLIFKEHNVEIDGAGAPAAGGGAKVAPQPCLQGRHATTGTARVQELRKRGTTGSLS